MTLEVEGSTMNQAPTEAGRVIRVYRYGLLPPTQNATVVREQMQLAHRYRNTLTEIERGRRAAVRAVESTVGDMPSLEAAHATADAELEAALKAVRGARAASRGRSETVEMKDRVKAARVSCSEARKALQSARRLLREDVAIVAARDFIGERAGELRRSARAYCGLGENGPHFGAWGSYLLVESSAEQASKTTPLYDGAEPCDPQFSRWTGEGRVGVQIQGGLPIAEMFSSQARWLRVGAVDERAFYDRSGGKARDRGEGKRSRMRTTLRMRVGSEGREPIWAEWPMMMHRPIPPGAVVKTATVSQRRIGPREEWYVCITADVTECSRPHTCGAGRAALNFGWRALAEGRCRVATFVDDDGEVGTVELERRFFDALDKADDLRSTRDKNFDAAVTNLDRWRTALLAILPESFAQATATLRQWKSPGRLCALAKRWRDARFAGDEEAYDALEAWRYKDHHLWEWETSQRAKTLRYRREKYREFARKLSTRYGEVLLPAFDLRTVARRGRAEDPHENETARRNRQRAAVSELAGAIKNAVAAARGIVRVENAAESTHICSRCGSVEDFDAAVAVDHVCAVCGEIWDQDENACRVLLKRERRRDDGSPVGARGPKEGGDSAMMSESKWKRAARMAEEKKVRRGGARKSDDDAAE